MNIRRHHTLAQIMGYYSRCGLATTSPMLLIITEKIVRIVFFPINTHVSYATGVATSDENFLREKRLYHLRQLVSLLSHYNINNAFYQQATHNKTLSLNINFVVEG